jgi:hypothetical protein
MYCRWRSSYHEGWGLDAIKLFDQIHLIYLAKHVAALHGNFKHQGQFQMATTYIYKQLTELTEHKKNYDI